MFCVVFGTVSVNLNPFISGSILFFFLYHGVSLNPIPDWRDSKSINLLCLPYIFSRGAVLPILGIMIPSMYQRGRDGMVDIPDLKSGGLSAVWVRVPPSAPNLFSPLFEILHGTSDNRKFAAREFLSRYWKNCMDVLNGANSFTCHDFNASLFYR